MADLPPREALDAYILRFIQDKRHSEGVDVLPEYADDFLTLYGLIQRVRRLAQSYLRLRKQGFSSEGQILVRAAMEHAVTAQYAFLTPSGIARLHVTLGRAHKNYAVVLAESSTKPEIHEWAARIEAPDGSSLPPFSGEGMMGQLDSIKFLKTTYKVLSQVGHVSHESQFDAFVEDDGRYHLTTEPQPSFTHEVLYALVGFCLLSDWVLARLEGNEAELHLIRQLGGQLRLPWRLDTHLTAEKRRFPNEIE